MDQTLTVRAAPKDLIGRSQRFVPEGAFRQKVLKTNFSSVLGGRLADIIVI